MFSKEPNIEKGIGLGLVLFAQNSVSDWGARSVRLRAVSGVGRCICFLLMPSWVLAHWTLVRLLPLLKDMGQ